jgi:endonuclease-8
MEGPSVRDIADRLSEFTEKTVVRVNGNTKEDKSRAADEPIRAIFSRGKNLFLQFPDFSFKIHFLMFGSYRVNEEREGMTPRLAFYFDDGFIHFYNCSVKLFPNQDIDAQYPEDLDITSPAWDLDKAVRCASEESHQLACDLLLDQEVFPGVGNIIKNEALWMAKTHPLSLTGRMSRAQMCEMAARARDFSMLFYHAKQTETELRSHFQIYRKRICHDCRAKITRKKTGTRKRISFFCPSCQVLYH